MITKSEITIVAESEHHGEWLKIYIPYAASHNTFASIQNTHGEVIKHLKLMEGNNAIDISTVDEEMIDVKVTTPYETILRQIKIPHYEKP